MIQPPENPFHVGVQQAFEPTARLYADLNMQFRVLHIDPNQPKRSAAQISELMIDHDGMIVCCPDSEEVAAALRRFDEQRPVITLETDVHDSGRGTYIGSDNRKAGRVAGDLMGQLLRPAGGDMIIVTGLPSTIGPEEREAGFRSVLH